MKKVYGKYLNSTDASSAIEELLVQGYNKDDIKVVSKSKFGRDLNQDHAEIQSESMSLWEKLKEAFTHEEYDDEYLNKNMDENERTLLEPYRTNLESGESLILIEDRDDLEVIKSRKTPNWDEREREFYEDLDE